MSLNFYYFENDYIDMLQHSTLKNAEHIWRGSFAFNYQGKDYDCRPWVGVEVNEELFLIPLTSTYDRWNNEKENRKDKLTSEKSFFVELIYDDNQNLIGSLKIRDMIPVKKEKVHLATINDNYMNNKPARVTYMQNKEKFLNNHYEEVLYKVKTLLTKPHRQRQDINGIRLINQSL